MMIKKFLIHANQRSELGIDRSQDLTVVYIVVDPHRLATT